MDKNRRRDAPEITVPENYDLFDLIDTDDDGYDMGEPELEEEVKINFERNDRK